MLLPMVSWLRIRKEGLVELAMTGPAPANQSLPASQAVAEAAPAEEAGEAADRPSDRDPNDPERPGADATQGDRLTVVYNGSCPVCRAEVVPEL
jgi:cytochrome c5